MNIIIKILFLFSLFPHLTFSSVIIYTDIPESIEKLRAITQKIVTDEIVELESCLFEIDSYAPHISLAYLTDKPLTMEKLEHLEPTLEKDLRLFAKSFVPIDMKNSTFELAIWKNVKPSFFEGKFYKNYVILVIKINPPQELFFFVEKLDELLKNHPHCTPRTYPFIPHVTIGWIYDKEDTTVDLYVEKLKTKLEKEIAKITIDGQFIIDSFILSTEDQQKIHFQINK